MVFRSRRDQGMGLRIDLATIGRDVGVFLIFFAVAAGVGLVELPIILKVVVAIVLAFGYGLYVRRTLTSGEHLEEVPERLLILPRSEKYRFSTAMSFAPALAAPSSTPACSDGNSSGHLS